jgi:hypothetical protein
VRGINGFNGHFVPITGFESGKVLVHNPGPFEAKPFYELSEELFLKAWDDLGTDKDTIVIWLEK